MLSKTEIEELKKRITDGAIQVVGSSFNDNTHSVYAQKPIAELKFAPRIAKKLIFPLLMAFPFDPYLGKETEEYNSRTKYNALMAPDQMMALIKMACDEDAELKKFYMKMAKFRGTWDTAAITKDADGKTLKVPYYVVDTVEDQQILWIYRRRMTYAFPSIRVLSSAIGGDKYPTVYLLDSKQDAITGEFTGELSFIHKAGAMMGAMCKREIQSFNDGIESKDVNTLSRKMARSFAIPEDYLSKIPNTEHMDARARRGDIRQCYPLSSPQPLLTTIGLQFDVTPITGTVTEQVADKKYELYDHFKDEIQYKAHIFFTAKYDAIDAIDAIVGNYFPKDPKKYAERNSDTDLYPNFCVLDFITENTSAKMTQEEKMNAGRDMNFTTEKKPLYVIEESKWAHKGLAKFAENLSGFFTYAQEEDLVDGVRSLLIKSYKPVNDGMTSAAAREIELKFPLTSPLYDDNIKIAYSDLLISIYPKEMSEAFANLTASDADGGQELFDSLLEEDNSMSLDTPATEDREEDDDPPIGVDDADSVDADQLEA